VLGETLEDEVLEIAASLERSSEHPLAEAIVNYAKDESIPLSEVSGFRAIPGHGVEGMVGEKKYFFGQPQTDRGKGGQGARAGGAQGRQTRRTGEDRHDLSR
jgi:P-type Cu+ transporter